MYYVDILTSDFRWCREQLAYAATGYVSTLSARIRALRLAQTVRDENLHGFLPYTRVVDGESNKVIAEFGPDSAYATLNEAVEIPFDTNFNEYRASRSSVNPSTDQAPMPFVADMSMLAVPDEDVKHGGVHALNIAKQEQRAPRGIRLRATTEKTD